MTGRDINGRDGLSGRRLPGRHCADPAGGTTRRGMTSSPGWREPAAFWQPRRYRRQAEQMRAAKTDAGSAIREFCDIIAT